MGIADILPADVFTIFPNPTQNYIQITMKDKAADAICITDISGKVVYEIRSTGRPNELKIPVGQLADGVYCLQVISGSQKGAKTFVVRH